MRRKQTPEMKTRMRRFRAALALRDLTIAEWASKNGLSYSHTYQVLTGRRESPKMIARVEQFSDEVLGSATAAPIAVSA